MPNKNSLPHKKVRDNIFTPYLSGEEITKGLENGLIKGGLRLNPRNYKEAYMTHFKLDSDVLVFDKDINRALYDDIVAVKIHPKYEWKVQNEVTNADGNLTKIMEQLSLKTNNNIPHMTIRMLLTHCPNYFIEKFGWDMSSINLNDNIDFASNCTNWWKYFQRTGTVVAIIQKMNSRYCVGTLNIPENAKTLSFVRFIPTDIRYPRLVVPLAECPADFIKRPLDYKEVKFIARIGDWKETDLNPRGHINQCLKNMTLIDQETAKILAESGFQDNEFSESILSSLPESVVTEEDILYRRDVRSECVFSIDPKTARDLDDALHIKEVHKDGKRLWEVGVHIADVSYYMLADSELDSVASERTTTVYMVHKAVPMLPRALCENLCSLHPGTDKMSYSVIYTITDDCQIVDVWIGRTIMNSVCKLSYEEAQTVLDNPDKTHWMPEDFGEIFGKFSAVDIAQSILRLNHLAVQMRQRRFDNGSLWINQPKIGFVLNDDRTVPLGYRTYKLSASNHLIEEWMLQANITVAEFIHKHLPKTAFLRCHPSPTIQAINNINKQFEQMGWKNLSLHSGSTDEFQKLMSAFEKDDTNFVVMMNICSKAMQLAQYFCNNCEDSDCFDGCEHFALSVPLYTHFTSPIRRYPDVIVHRQITQILIKQQEQLLEQGDQGASGRIDWLSRTSSGESATVTRLAYLGDYCNKKKKDAKTADEASIALFYTIFVQKSGPFTESAIVMGLLDKAFDVLLTHCGFTKRAYLNQMDVRTSSFCKQSNRLTIVWKQGPACGQQGHPATSTVLGLLSEVRLTVSAAEEGPHSSPKLKLVLPNPGCLLCGLCDDEAQPRDISSLQSQMDIVDDNRLYNILDDI